jgi:hypothetical protein
VQVESENVEVMGEGGRACDDSEADKEADGQAIRRWAGMQARMRKGQRRRGAGEGVARGNWETALVMRREREVTCEKRVAAAAWIQIAWHDD